MKVQLKKFIDCYIPVTTCNFRCSYCYITHGGHYKNALPKFEYSPETIINALCPDRLGGPCYLNFCAGGETLLPEEVIEIVKGCLKNGHYVSIVTNGSISKRFDQILEFPPEYLRRLFIKFSFHYLELKRQKLFDRFFNNVKRMRNAGCSITVELTPSDDQIPHIQDIKDMCMKELGALCHVTIARNDVDKNISILTELSKEDYIKTWGQFNSALFDFKISVFGNRIPNFCYAGNWTGHLNLRTGILNQCYGGKSLGNVLEDINAPWPQTAKGYQCKLPHCYNAHSLISLGDMPDFDAPTYLELRQRIPENQPEWVTNDIKELFSQKLVQNNQLLTDKEKDMANKWSEVKIPFFKKWRRKIKGFILRKKYD